MPGFNINVQNPCVGEWDTELTNTPAYIGPKQDIELARSHRYKLEVLDPLGNAGASSGSGILLFLEKCTRPTPEIDEITIHSGQDEIYRPGKNRWNPVEFTFYEKLDGKPQQGALKNSAAERIYRWWAETMINTAISAHNPVVDYYRRAELSMLDGYGADIWTYYLYDCWPVKVSPSDLDYSSTDLSRITVTLRYNKAQEKKANENNNIRTYGTKPYSDRFL